MSPFKSQLLFAHTTPSFNMSEDDLKRRQQSPAFQFLKRQQQIAEWLEKIFNKQFDSHNFIEHELMNGVYLCKLMLLLDRKRMSILV